MRYEKVTKEVVMRLNPGLVEKIYREANKSPSRYRHVSVALDKRGRAITMTHNRGDGHSEHRLIQKFFSTAKFYGKGGLHTILVVRVSPGGSWGISSPCFKCRPLLENLNVKILHS